MKILNFIAGLLPSFSKSRVIEDIRITRNEIKETTEPAYESAASLFTGWQFKSEQMKEMIEVFNRMVKRHGSDNMIVTISKGFKEIIENLNTVEKFIDKAYGEEISSNGITYYKAQILQLAETIGFVSKYARKFLVYVYVCETNALNTEQTGFDSALTPAEIKWIEEGFISFCTAFGITSNTSQTVKHVLEDIPDVIVTQDNVDTLAATIGSIKIDPLEMNLIPISLNPIYRIGMIVAEWQASRYKASKEEMKLLELRKLNLEKLSAGKPDAHLQKEIEYMETRIQSLNFKIAKMEKDANV